MNSVTERSHPLLWTAGLVAATLGLAWIFGHWLIVGMRHAREAERLNLAAATPVAPVDHPALIADRSPAVLERGQVLYGRNCAACHGPSGDTNASGSNPAPRNFKTEAFQATWGGGPYGFYLTLTKGWGQGMPGFANLSAADRYAITHYVRETWIKGTAHYAPEDAPAVAAQIPKPGAAVEGPKVPAHLVEQPRQLHPLMAAVAPQSERQAIAVAAWLAQAGRQDALLGRAATAGRSHPGWAIALAQAAAGRDAAQVQLLLIDAASGDPSLALAPAPQVAAAVQTLLAVPAPEGL